MSHLKLLIAAIISAVNSYSYAANECSRFSDLEKKYEVNFSGCKCGEALKSHPELKRNGLKLIAACFDEKQYKEAGMGVFYYVGDGEISGMMSYPEGTNDSLSFNTKSSGSFDFSSSNETIDSVKYPMEMLGKVSGCESHNFSAVAKLKIKFVEDVKADSCQGGSWVKDFEVLSVGKYSCQK